MAFGFPPFASGQHNFGIDLQILYPAVMQTIHVLRWSGGQSGPYTFEASSGFSLWSYGEKIRITIDGQGTVHVHSECSWPLTLFDWGKNDSNVGKFLATLGSFVANPQPHPSYYQQ